MEVSRLFLKVRIKNTELMDDVLDIIREHIQCELGYGYGGCVLIEDGTHHTILKICIKNAFKDGKILVRKHLLDSSICDAIKFNISDVNPEVIGPYYDDNDQALTSDFFVNESDFDGVIRNLAIEEGISEEKINLLCSNNERKEKLIGEWLDFASEEEANLQGKEFLKGVLRKYVI